MQSKSLVRIMLLACALAVCLGVFAGVSAGSGVKPLRATAPKLIAHDTSSSFPLIRIRKAPKSRGPQVFVPPRKKAA